MSKHQSPPAVEPEAPPAPKKTRWTVWSKFAKHQIGDKIRFTPFVEGMSNVGRVPGLDSDRPIKVDVSQENRLYRGFFQTTDPELGAYLEERCNSEHELFNAALYLHRKEEV